MVVHKNKSLLTQMKKSYVYITNLAIHLYLSLYDSILKAVEH
jgi:hypothetical protein